MAIASSIIAAGLIAGATTATSIYGAKKASSAAERAADVSDAANREAIAFEREREARRQQEWDRMMNAEEARWNAEQERMAPYRAASEGALSQLVSLAGLPAYSPQPVEKPDFTKAMPQDWQPGDPTGLEQEASQAAAPVRKPTSSKLSDLLSSDPTFLQQATEAGAAMVGGMGGRPEIETAAAETGVSDAAYQRLAPPPPAEASVRSLVRGRGMAPPQGRF